uniref:Uncharacterized protein n=1 Tax=Timema genevievae TaxID=629358 RepID=A0A7R9PRH7_TIMGE|nr:unnamed protein product [Timema genevievae]
MAVDIILDKNEENNRKDIEIVTPLKKFKSNMHLITSTPNKTPDNVLNNRLSVTNTKYDEYESFLYEQKFETTNNYESEDESTLVDEITKLETTLQNLEDSLGQVSPVCLKTNEDYDATNIDSVLNAETDAETLITIDEYYDSCYIGCSSDSKPKDKSSFLQSHSSFEPEQATSADKNIFSKNSPEESQNTFNRTIFELSKHDSKDLPNLENKYFSSESCSNTDKSTSKQCPLINIDLTSQKKNEFFPSEFKNEFEFLPAEFRNEVGCLPAQFGNEVEGLATELSKNKDTLLKCSEFDLYKDAFKCIKSNQNQDVDCLHKNKKPDENEQKYLEDGLDDDKDDCIDEDKLLEGPEDNIDDKMRYPKTIAGNLNVAPVNISESLKLLAAQENESKLDDVTDKKMSIKGSATMNREAKEFVSNDPKENEDNNNENWEVLRKLETDPERYKAMRKRWRNLVTPDPNKNLTIRSWKGKSLIQEGDGANSLVKLVPNERLSNKRKRSNDDNRVSKHQRSENHPCILFYEQKMDNLLRTMKDEVSFVDQEHQQALLRLGCKQQYESQNLENFMGKFFRFTPSGQQLYNKQSQETFEVNRHYENAILTIEVKGQADLERLNKAADEVFVVHSFYNGINSDDSNIMYMSEEQLTRLKEFEKYYQIMNNIYS